MGIVQFAGPGIAQTTRTETRHRPATAAHEGCGSHPLEPPALPDGTDAASDNRLLRQMWVPLQARYGHRATHRHRHGGRPQPERKRRRRAGRAPRREPLHPNCGPRVIGPIAKSASLQPGFAASSVLIASTLTHLQGYGSRHTNLRSLLPWILVIGRCHNLIPGGER